jgi:thioredoxin reductase (NADPH)
VAGAGPTGIAIGADAVRAGLRRCSSSAALDLEPAGFPDLHDSFTTRDLLEIADIPFAVPDEKPDRRQALAYYRAVARPYDLPLALHEEVEEVRRDAEGFVVGSRAGGAEVTRRAGAVAFATGYFGQPKRLAVEGEDLPRVKVRYRDAYRHFGEPVVIVGGGNWRPRRHSTSGARGPGGPWFTGEAVKETVKYWVKPDIENRIAEGSIAARFWSRSPGFRPPG